MTIHQVLVFHVGGALSLALMSMEVMLAAGSFSNSLTAFTGNSTQATTQAAVGIAGFNFFTTTGADGHASNPTVSFDGNGASFGTFSVAMVAAIMFAPTPAITRRFRLWQRSHLRLAPAQV